MKQFLTSVKALLCVWLIMSALMQNAVAGTVTGQVQTPSGGPFANATFSFTLTQPALVSGTASVAPATINCYTDGSGNVVGEPNPLVIPTVSANIVSGTLGAATYFVKITYFDGTGESVASPEATLILSSTGTLVVTAPNRQPTGASGYKVYISTSTGTETLQGTVTGTPGSWGNFSQASALGAGTALPGSNTTSCKLRFNDELQPSFVCYDVGLISSSGNTLPGYPQYWYLSGGSGGTINIGVGTPQSTVCQGSGVSYPQSIVAQPIGNATQSISGGLDLGTNPLNAGVGTFSSTLIFKTSLGVCDASKYAGATWDAQITAALADVNCGFVNASSLSFALPSAATVSVSANKAVFLPCTTITGGATVNPVFSVTNSSSLFGKSRSCTVITTNSGTADIVAVASSNNWWQITDLTIQSAVARTAGAGIHVQGGHGVIERVVINPVFDGITFDVAGLSDNNAVRDVELTNGTGSPSAGAGAAWHCGVKNGGVATGTVSGNILDNVTISMFVAFTDAGFCIQDGSDTITISNSQAVANLGGSDSTGLHLEVVNAGQPPNQTKIIGSGFEGGLTKNGVLVDSAINTEFTNVTSQSSLRGMLINGGTSIRWTGGQFHLNQQEGVRITGGNDVKIIGATFSESSQQTTNTFDDIAYVQAGGANFQFIGNTHKDNFSTGKVCKWGIEITSASANNFAIMGDINNSNCGTGAISNVATGSTQISCNPGGPCSSGPPIGFSGDLSAARSSTQGLLALATSGISLDFGVSSSGKFTFAGGGLVGSPYLSGTAAMTTAGIATGACGTTVTVVATGVLTTDNIVVTHNAAATIGNGGGLTLNAWPTAGNVNFNYCNSSAGTITPTAMTVNWAVMR